MIKAFIGSGDNILINKEVKEIYLDTDKGNIGILDGHENMISSVKIGEMRIIDNDNKENIYSISEGVLKIENIGDVTNVNILLEEIDHIDSLSEEALQEAIKRAEEISKEKTDTDFDIVDKQLFRDLNKLKLARKYKGMNGM